MELVYPMSVSYVADWDVERAIAELIANALDEDNSARAILSPAGISIVDRGSGWPEEALVFGYSAKTDTQIGQFGEGAKIAMLVLARSLPVNAVKIDTVGFTIRPRIERRRIAVVDAGSGNEGLDLLVLDITPNRRRVGTRVEVAVDQEVALAARNRFLQFSSRNYSPPEGVGRVVAGEPGRVYVGGVLVAAGRDLTLSYDFPLSDAKRLQNRDRSVIDGWEVERLVTRTLAHCTNAHALEKVTRAALAGTLGRMEQGVGASTTPQQERVWKRVRRAVFGAQKVFWKGESTAEQALDLGDRGWRELPCTYDQSNFARLMAALDIPDARRAAGKRNTATKWVPRTQLSATAKARLARQVRTAKRILGPDAVAAVKVFEHASDLPNARGFYDPSNGTIALQRDVLDDETTLATTLIHEIAHRRAHLRGDTWEDRTRGFESALSEIAAMTLVSRPRRRAPSEKHAPSPDAGA